MLFIRVRLIFVVLSLASFLLLFSCGDVVTPELPRTPKPSVEKPSDSNTPSIPKDFVKSVVIPSTTVAAQTEVPATVTNLQPQPTKTAKSVVIPSTTVAAQTEVPATVTNLQPQPTNIVPDEINPMIVCWLDSKTFESRRECLEIETSKSESGEIQRGVKQVTQAISSAPSTIKNAMAMQLDTVVDADNSLAPASRSASWGFARAGGAGIEARSPGEHRAPRKRSWWPPAVFQGHGVNPYIDTDEDRLSTFSLDGDTASWEIFKEWLLENDQLVPPDAVRVEEWVNALTQDYYYEIEGASNSIQIHADGMLSPFASENTHVLRIGLSTNPSVPDRGPIDLIFVLDTSGSMELERRFEVAIEAIALIAAKLDHGDRVGLVTYANNVRTHLEPQNYKNYSQVASILSELWPGGSTYAESGIKRAYDIADPERETKIVLLSDGLANVGATGPEAILEIIDEASLSRHSLTAIGVGSELNYNDHLLETLANRGNGTYHYVNNIRQLKNFMREHSDSIYNQVVRDARVQVGFNPEIVRRYRLVGYENRAVADEDFRDDSLDFGEPGFARDVTALYEMRFNSENFSPQDEVATIYVRWLDPSENEVVEKSEKIIYGSITTSEESPPSMSLRRSLAVAEFAELMRKSFWSCSPDQKSDEPLGDLLSYVEKYDDSSENELLSTIRDVQRILGYDDFDICIRPER